VPGRGGALKVRARLVGKLGRPSRPGLTRGGRLEAARARLLSGFGNGGVPIGHAALPFA